MIYSPLIVQHVLKTVHGHDLIRGHNKIFLPILCVFRDPVGVSIGRHSYHYFFVAQVIPVEVIEALITYKSPTNRDPVA